MTLERETSVRHNVDLSLITSVTNPAEVAKLLSDVYNEERVVDEELRNLISRRATFEDLLNTAIQESNEVGLTNSLIGVFCCLGPGSGQCRCRAATKRSHERFKCGRRYQQYCQDSGHDPIQRQSRFKSH